MPDSLITYQFGWWQFLLVAASILLLFLAYKLLLQNRIFAFLDVRSSLKLDERVLFFNRCLIIAVFLVLTFAFLLVNPMMHGLCCAVLLLLGYRYFANYVQGTFIIRELKLVQGLPLKIEGQMGRLHRLGATGIVLAVDSALVHIPYGKLVKNNITLLNQLPVYKLVLHCKPTAGNLEFEKARTQMLRSLFGSPFISDDQMPFIKESANGLEASIVAKNASFAQNIIQTIEKSGFEVTPLTK